MPMSNSVQWLRRASVIASTAAIMSLAGLSSPASAADQVKVLQFFGPGVVLSNMYPSSPRSTVKLPVSVVAKTKTAMYGLLSYNPSTCTELTPGTWTVTTAPKKGTTSTQVLTGPPPSCTTKGKWKYNVIFYTSKVNKGKDKVVAKWTAPNTESVTLVATITISP